jgi:hypothetical protein
VPLIIIKANEDNNVWIQQTLHRSEPPQIKNCSRSRHYNLFFNHLDISSDSPLMTPQTISTVILRRLSTTVSMVSGISVLNESWSPRTYSGCFFIRSFDYMLRTVIRFHFNSRGMFWEQFYAMFVLKTHIRYEFDLICFSTEAYPTCLSYNDSTLQTTPLSKNRLLSGCITSSYIIVD